MINKKIISLFLIIGTILFQALLSEAANGSIPEVQFAIIIVEPDHYEILGFAELSQTYRKSIKKSMPDTGFSKVGNVFIKEVPPADFGYISIFSELTGQEILHIKTAWGGGASLVFPPDSLFNTEYGAVFNNLPPKTISYIPGYNFDETAADSAWNAVKNLDIIGQLAASGSYDVVIMFEVAWIIIAYSHPTAPTDVGLIGDSWPNNFIMENVSNLPQISVHNFSDSPLDFNVIITSVLDGSIFQSSSRVIKSLPEDATKIVQFDTLEINSGNELIINYKINSLDGSSWIDAFEDNDLWSDTLEVSNAPVFRPISTLEGPRTIPLHGVALDFDDDDDIDIVEIFNLPKLWRRNSVGDYEDITDLSDNFFEETETISVLAEDFNGDGLTDLLFVYWNEAPQLLIGQGSGIFVDNTPSAFFDLEHFTGIAKAVDVEMDGDMDIILDANSKVIVAINNGSGIFSIPEDNQGINNTANVQDINAGDLNNDGYLDLVISNWNRAQAVYINDGNGKYSLLNGSWNFEYGRTARIFDYNNDGLNDILFLQRLEDDENHLYTNSGNLVFVEDTSQSALRPGQFHVGIGDVNEDGWIDLILDDLGEFTLLLNMGGKFVDFTDHLAISVYDAQQLLSTPRPEFIDIDGDGDLDIYSKALVLQNQIIPNFVKVNINDEIQLVETYILSQNYPNPFNPTTTIKYTLPQAGEVLLIIYNITGQEVARLIDSIQRAGNHNIIWDASTFASGIYLYRLQSGNFIQTRKMLYLK